MKRCLLLVISLWLAAAVTAQANQRLTLQAKRVLVRQVCKDYGKMREHDSDLEKDCKQGRIDKIIKAAEFVEIDLNGDGQREYRLAVRTPGAELTNSAERDFYVYQKMPQSYSLLLGETAYDLTARKSTTNGYRDLLGESQGAATLFRVYKYDGKRYKEAECWREETDKRGRKVRNKC